VIDTQRKPGPSRATSPYAQEGNRWSFGTHRGGLRPPETVRNFGPKTGNEFGTAANVIGVISTFADNNATAR
jgi:hypothetical protein